MLTYRHDGEINKTFKQINMDAKKLNKMVGFQGYELLFYVNENGNYTVRVLGDAEATEKLLAACKHKSVKPERLYFFIKGIKGKISAGVLKSKGFKAPFSWDKTQNPVIILGELVQKKWGRNITTEVIGKSGYDHCPTIEVAITLPNGRVVRATGDNKQEAKRAAAREILDTWDFEE